MSSEQNGWRGLAADLLAAEPQAIQAIQHQVPTAPATDEIVDRSSPAAAGKRRRRRTGESFASTNQLVGLWLPLDMAAELRARAEQAGLSNSEFVREIFRKHFAR